MSSDLTEEAPTAPPAESEPDEAPDPPEHSELTDEEELLSEEVRERRNAALAEVRRFGDPVLKSVASPVTDFGPELAREAERMVAIMNDALGVGLAATQLGVMRRMLIFQASMDGPASAIVNPQVEWLSEDLVIAEEGCLSLPGVVVDVERPLHARVSGSDIAGEPLLIEASGLEARVLQHEIDHLDGKLILDRTEREQRRAALKALREGGNFHPRELDPVDEAEEDDPADRSEPPEGPNRSEPPPSTDPETSGPA